MGKEDGEFSLEHVDVKMSKKHLCVYICACLSIQQVVRYMNLKLREEVRASNKVMVVINMQLVME